MKFLRRTCLTVAASCGVFTAFRAGSTSRPRILAYHGVTDRDDDPLNFDGFHIPVATFEAHLRTLAGHYRVVPLGQIAAAIAQKRPFAPGSVAITFDDGYLDNATLAAPLLARHGLKATFFITTGFLDGLVRPWWFDLRRALHRAGHADFQRAAIAAEYELKNLPADERRARLDEQYTRTGQAAAAPVRAMMNWDHVRALVAAGHEIGVHTVSHPSLGHESREVIEREIRDAGDRIRAECGVAPTLFAYPYGGPANRSAVARSVLARAGFAAAVTTDERWVSAEDDPLDLPRINVGGGMDRLVFRARMAGLKRSDAARPQPAARR